MPGPLICVRATDDLDLIHELDRVLFPYDSRLDGPDFLDAQWWVAEQGSTPVAYGGLLVQSGR